MTDNNDPNQELIDEARELWELEYLFDEIKISSDDGGKCLDFYFDSEEDAANAQANIPHKWKGLRTVFFYYNN